MYNLPAFPETETEKVLRNSLWLCRDFMQVTEQYIPTSNEGTPLQKPKNQ